MDISQITEDEKGLDNNFCRGKKSCAEHNDSCRGIKSRAEQNDSCRSTKSRAKHNRLETQSCIGIDSRAANSRLETHSSRNRYVREVHARPQKVIVRLSDEGSPAIHQGQNSQIVITF